MEKNTRRVCILLYRIPISQKSLVKNRYIKHFYRSSKCKVENKNLYIENILLPNIDFIKVHCVVKFYEEYLYDDMSFKI